MTTSTCITVSEREYSLNQLVQSILREKLPTPKRYWNGNCESGPVRDKASVSRQIRTHTVKEIEVRR